MILLNIAVADKDVVIIKMIKQPNVKEFTTLVAKARKAAKKAGLTKASLKQTIKEARTLTSCRKRIDKK